MLRNLLLTTTLGAMVHAGPAYADTNWSTAVHTGTPHFSASGDPNVTTFVDPAHGPCVQHRNPGGFFETSTRYVYVSVTPAAGSAFSKIQSQASDNTANGYVKAQLQRREKCDPGATAQLLGSVTTADVVVPAGGFQCVSDVLTAPPVLTGPSVYSYWIR
jgi:hypothetical protein